MVIHNRRLTLPVVQLIIFFAKPWLFSFAEHSTINNGICSNNPADVIFVLDSSGSIADGDFKRQMKFVTSVIDHFPVGQNSTRVGVVSFSNWAQVEFFLKDFDSTKKVKDAISQMVQMKGDTNTAAALGYVHDVMLTPEFGARPEAPHVIVVLTDGKSNDPKKTSFEAARARETGNVHLFAIGVGTEVDLQELTNIANQPPDQYVFKVENYAALETIKELLAAKTCQVTDNRNASQPDDQACGVGIAADVVFASSPAANEGDTSKTMSFFGEISSKLDIDKDKVRVSLVPRDCDTSPEMSLMQRRPSVKSLRRFQKRHVPSTVSVLKYMNKFSYTKKHGGRPNTKRIGILIVDSSTDRTKQVLKEAIRAKEKLGIELFIIGIGKGVSQDELQSIASYPPEGHVFHISGYDELPSIVDKVTRTVCPVSLLL